VKKIPKRYRKVESQEPTISLIGMVFKWNEKEWKVTGYDGKVAFIQSGSIHSQIDLALLPKIAENVRAA
jgi:hypothetical protein